ncbi:hypothetical protein ACX9NE_05245 [Mycobacterium sp. ML4]
MTGKMTPEQWAKQRARKRANKKRDRAIELLRATGMTDDEIAKELDAQEFTSIEVVDAEIVENLPARIDYVESERGEKTTSGKIKPMESDSVSKNGLRAPHPTKPGRDTKNRSLINANVEHWNAHLEDNAERRCNATNSYGEECRKYAVRGTSKCAIHGASAPQVKRKAKERLELAADRMACNLLGLAVDAESESVKLAATNSALDRAGLKPNTEVVLSQGNAFDEIMSDLQFGTMTREESRRARGLDPDTAQPLGGNESSAFNLADYQGNCTPASALHEPNIVGTQQHTDINSAEFEGGIQSDKTHFGSPTSNESDSDPIPRPLPRPGRDRAAERRSGPTITGDAALDLAAQINRVVGALRELE